MTPAVLAAVVARGQSLEPVLPAVAGSLRLVADTLRLVAAVAGSPPAGRSLGSGLVGFGLVGPKTRPRGR